MPPLSSLSINSPQQQQQQQQQPPVQGYNPPPPSMPSYYMSQQQQQMQPQAIRQTVHSPPAEAHIQSWADNVEQEHPKPKPPIAPVASMGGAWMPEMGIKFASGPAAGQSAQSGGGSGAQGKGTWEPTKGIRFG